MSRAGANAICELLALRKPNILIPLGLEASRGDQILNAESFENQGYSYVLQEKDVTSETLLNAVNSVYEDRDKYIEAMNHSKLANPIETIVNLANSFSKKETMILLIAHKKREKLKISLVFYFYMYYIQKN